MQGSALVGRTSEKNVVIEITTKSGELVTEYRVNPNGDYFIVLESGQYVAKFKQNKKVIQRTSFELKTKNLSLQHLF